MSRPHGVARAIRAVAPTSFRVLDRAADAFTATSTSITLFWSSTPPQSTEVLTEVTVYNKAP